MVLLMDLEKRPLTPTEEEGQEYALPPPPPYKLEEDQHAAERSDRRRRRSRFRRFSLLHCLVICSMMFIYKSFDFSRGSEGHHGHHHGHGKRPLSRAEHFEKLFL